MWLYLVIGCLFLYLVVGGLVQGPLAWGPLLGAAAVSAAMFGMWGWVKACRRSSRNSLTWIIANRDRITDEPRRFIDSPWPSTFLSTDTQLREFNVVFSLFFVTCYHTTGYDVRWNFFRGVSTTLWSLLLGWWGFPWGPIRTLETLVVNLGGGDRLAVRDLVEDARGALESAGAADPGSRS
jgi:hypothetical protein